MGFDFSSLLDVKNELSLDKLSSLGLDTSQLDFAKFVLDANSINEKLKDVKSFYSEKLKVLDDVTKTIQEYKEKFNTINEQVTTLKTITNPTQKINEITII